MFEERRRKRFLRGGLAAFLTIIVIGIIGVIVLPGYFTQSPPQNQQVPQPQQLQVQQEAPKLTQTEADADDAAPVSPIASVAKAATPGVVGISVLKMDGGSIFEKNAAEKWGVGSGAIVSKKGYIITNNHVAGGKNKRIIVSLSDGRNVDGVTVWSEPVLDLAIVKINLPDLSTIPLGDSNNIQVGETAVAIGNPLGLQFQRTVTSGIVSALNRTIKIDTDSGPNFMEDLIQTDASINPGNSGGPLLNHKGQIIGINTIKVSSAEGIGFAVPINVAIPIIRKLDERGEFSEPYLGVFAYDREVIPYIDGSLNFNKGIYVANVDEQGPAYKGGVRVGCIITQVDGNDISTMLQLRTYMYTKNPGDTINITHISDGKTETMAIQLAAKEKDGLLTR